jgi:uncharacterized membrane protein YbhN (UPF0104 family)
VFEKITNNIDDLQENIQSYAKSTIEYYKLDLFKRLTKSTISVSRILLLGAIASLIFIFLSFGLAFLIVEALGNNSYGFFILGVFYIIVFVITAIVSRKKLEKVILKSASRIFFDD